MHPLYHRARSLVGQPVVVHAHGRPHYGILHSVNDDGLYLSRVRQAGFTSTEEEANDAGSAELVFWPLFFLPWLAIGALYPWLWW